MIKEGYPSILYEIYIQLKVPSFKRCQKSPTAIGRYVPIFSEKDFLISNNIFYYRRLEEEVIHFYLTFTVYIFMRETEKKTKPRKSSLNTPLPNMKLLYEIFYLGSIKNNKTASESEKKC